MVKRKGINCIQVQEKVVNALNEISFVEIGTFPISQATKFKNLKVVELVEFAKENNVRIKFVVK